MAEAKKSDDIGMKQGRLLSNLSQTKQLDLIAEGLPILIKSAGDLMDASKALGEHHRAATILHGHAFEEIGKALILIDIVRCPSKFRSSRIGPMMTWFYDHLARLIYIDAQNWKPVNVKQLQEYVDHHRKSHYLEGATGEYIMPNWTTWSRESMLYADIVAYEDGELMWNTPKAQPSIFGFGVSSPWQVCQALQDMGALTRTGLDIMASVWSQVDFKDDQNWSSIERLTHEMLKALEEAALITEAAREEQLSVLYNQWQMPMYRITFKRLEVPLAELLDTRDSNLWFEMGY